MLKVGLTGGIASGKSTVAARFETLGIAVIYADKIAREVVEPGSKGLDAVQQAFGDSIVDSEGKLDRPALREVVFSDPEKRRILESILHPLIRQRSDALEAKAKNTETPYLVFEIPLLLETGRHKDMDHVVVVDVSPATQVTRVMARDNCGRTQAKEILSVQTSRSERLAIADDVIVNEGGLQELTVAVDELHKKLIKLRANDD